MAKLLTERRYDKITVQQILDRSGIGRSTFYSHFYDKQDVLASLMVEMLQRIRSDDPHPLPSLGLFRHVQQELGAQTLRRDAQVWDAARSSLALLVRQALHDAGTPAADIPLDVVSAGLVDGFLSLLRWWLDTGMPYTPEQMDEIYRRLFLPQGLAATD